MESAERPFPRGWDASTWASAREAIRQVIWQRGRLNELITYKALTEELDQSVYVHHRSKWLALLLNEIALVVRNQGGPWVTAFVVRSRSTCPGPGFFALVPRGEWEDMGKAAFCREQRRLSAEWILDHPDASLRLTSGLVREP